MPESQSITSSGGWLDLPELFHEEGTSCGYTASSLLTIQWLAVTGCTQVPQS